METVMMRCPTTGKDFETDLKLTRAQLKGAGLQTVMCPYCKHHHYLRRAFLKRDDPPDYFPADGLETAPAFAMEVGTIIAATVFMEAYIPQIYAKVTESKDVDTALFGAFSSTSQKIAVLEVLRHLKSHEKETKKDLDIVIKTLKECSRIRNFYAHSKYHYGHGGDTISVLPSFGDSRRRREGVTVSLEQIRDEADFIWHSKMMLREYIAGRARPIA